MKFRTVPKSQLLMGFGIVLVLAAIGFLIWSVRPESDDKSRSTSNQPTQSFQDESTRSDRDPSSVRHESRALNAESRVRSLLQIAPGEIGNIRVPSSGFDKFLPEGWEQRWKNMPLIPVTREQAIHGMEEILRNGDSLSSRVDVASGKISWTTDEIVVNGNVTELGEGLRNLDIVLEGKATNGKFYEESVKIQGYSFFLIRAPDSDAGGILLVIGENPK